MYIYSDTGDDYLFERIPDNFNTKGNCTLDETGKCRILTWRNRG